jgi:hypothetical protein
MPSEFVLHPRPEADAWPMLNGCLARVRLPRVPALDGNRQAFNGNTLYAAKSGPW